MAEDAYAWQGTPRSNPKMPYKWTVAPGYILHRTAMLYIWRPEVYTRYLDRQKRKAAK